MSTATDDACTVCDGKAKWPISEERVWGAVERKRNLSRKGRFDRWPAPSGKRKG
jgi:hypothetical protein